MSTPTRSRGRRRIVLAGLAVVAVVVTFVLVYFQPQKLFIDDHVNETIPVAGRVAERMGRFVSRDHGTEGTATIYRLDDGRRILRIEDLHTSNGPALVVYLSANPADGREGAFDDTYVDVGGLKGNIGDQNYEIPDDVKVEDYMSVVIWCERFSAAFGAADLA
ncbi:MAG: DM13 domain-containing protein [Acidimicrobiales bacterium]